MHEDCWAEIITFLEPIDVLTSMVSVDHSIYTLIKNSCIVTFDAISEFYVGCGDLKISFNNHDDNHRENIDHVPIYGNVKYFIRLYLLKLSLKLGNKKPMNGFQNEIAEILNSSELTKLDFYRSVFLKSKIPQQKDQLLIPYYSLGNGGIGTYYLCDFIQYGERQSRHLIGVDFFFKNFQIPNEIECRHQIWKSIGWERHVNYKSTKEEMMKKICKIKNMHFLPCFSMNHEMTLQTVGDWVAAIKEYSTSSKLPTFGIIIGLTTNDYSLDCEEKKVAVKDAVKKAFELDKSVFMECDDNHVYSPFWFIQLKLSYFTFKISEEKQVENNSNWNCSLL